jgi:hypothetical protein
MRQLIHHVRQNKLEILVGAFGGIAFRNQKLGASVINPDAEFRGERVSSQLPTKLPDIF